MGEKEFLEGYKSGQYEKPSVTADVLTFTVDQKVAYKLQVLMVKRKEHPYKDMWSLPGGFVAMDETLEDAAYRVIESKTGLQATYIEQLYTFSDVDRDPRMRIISTAYLNLVNKSEVLVRGQAEWLDLDVFLEEDGPSEKIYRIQAKTASNEVLNTKCKVLIETNPNRLEKSKQVVTVLESDFAFDHAKIICMGYLRIVNKVEYTNIAFHFVDEEFTMPSIQKVYESLMRKEIYKTSFKRMVGHMVVDTGKKENVDGFSKPAKLYKYNGGGYV